MVASEVIDATHRLTMHSRNLWGLRVFHSSRSFSHRSTPSRQVEVSLGLDGVGSARRYMKADVKWTPRPVAIL